MPGESVFARHDIIEDRPYSMQRYSIRVTWSPVTLGWHHPESRETSNAVSFVVRTPDSAEQAALDEIVTCLGDEERSTMTTPCPESL